MTSRILDTTIAKTRPLFHGRFFAQGVDWTLWDHIEGQRQSESILDVSDGAVPRVEMSRFYCREDSRKHVRENGLKLRRGFCRIAAGTFDSVYQHPEVERNRATFKWLRGGGERSVAVVLNHGSSGAWGLEERLLAIPLVRAGLDVVLPLTPGFGHRRKCRVRGRGFGRVHDWASSVAGVVASVLQLACDDLSLAAWLRQCGYTRVFVVGIGVGGAAAGMAAARGKGFDGHVVAMMGEHLADLWCEPSALCRAVDWAALQKDGVSSDSELRTLLEPASLCGLPQPPCTPGRLVAADRDCLVPPVTVRALAGLWGSRVDWIPGGHVSWTLHRHRIVNAIHSLVEEVISESPGCAAALREKSCHPSRLPPRGISTECVM